jgi:signal transduction histidine kinase/DNA-binding LacI/PurR family transcriptional regulator
MDRASKPWRIGYFNTVLSQSWSFGTWAGALKAARSRGVDLFSFHGQAFRTPIGTLSQENAIYDLARESGLDGLIAWKGHLTEYLTDPEAIAALKSYGVPVLIVEGRLEGFPSVTYGNRRGMELVVDHLAGAHGFTKIAYLGLVENHSGFRERHQGYLEGLRARGLPFSEEFVRPYIYWDWHDEKRRPDEALDEWLLKIIGLGAQAVIGSCDPIALWIMDRLDALGYSVPGDMAVAGFDAFASSAVHTPPLTALDPAWEDLGAAAIGAMVGILEGEAVPPETIIEPRLVVARSCGCEEEEVRMAGRPPGPPPAGDEGIIAALGAAGARAGRGIDYPGLLAAFRETCGGGGSGALLSAVERGLKATSRSNADPAAWQGILSILQGAAVRPGSGGPALHQACNQARAMIGNAERRAGGQRRQLAEERSDRERELGMRLITTFELNGILDALAEGLPRLGIGNCYLALYEDPRTYRFPDPAPEWARLWLALENGERRPLPEEGLRFRSRELLPAGFGAHREARVLAVNPLYFQREQIGFAAFDAGPMDMRLFETLCVQLSSALKGVLLVRKVEEQIADISRANGLLEQSYRELKENQQRLLASEKMASLGRLTAGIAHEMNTPLAAVRAALEEIEHLGREYRDSIGRDGVTEEDHSGIAADILKNAEAAARAAEKSSRFIRGIKSQSPARMGDRAQRFDATAAAEDSLSVLEHLFKRGACGLEHSLEPDARLMGDPRAFGQIVTNLATNAIDACQGGKGGTVRISLSRSADGGTELKVADSGHGISPEHMDKIFDPFFTTKPFGEGTGLGLSIVRDLVDQFGGTIEVSSVPGDTVFCVTFPQTAEP